MMENNLHIQWYPGHMTKTRRMMEKELPMMDAVVHLLDARIVASSMNPDFEDLFKHKKRMFLLNKADLAQPDVTQKWINYFKAQGHTALALSCADAKTVKAVIPTLQQLLSDKISRYEQKGMNKTMRVMITGIPNVGKSTMINLLAGRKVAAAQDRPGVTRAKQWVALADHIDLLDTPGMLWPRFEDQRTGMFLAFTGAINDDILDKTELALEFVRFMKENYPDALCERYKLTDDICDMEPLEIYEYICRKRGFLISGGDFDYERAAAVILDEFRAGKLGRISFEEP